MKPPAPPGAGGADVALPSSTHIVFPVLQQKVFELGDVGDLWRHNQRESWFLQRQSRTIPGVCVPEPE